MKLLFIDAIDISYDQFALQNKAKIGGTEGTIIRVAQLLATKHEVTIAQLGRQKETILDEVHYVPLTKVMEGNQEPDAVILIRPRREIKKLVNRFPKAKLFYWMHDIPGRRLWKYKRIFAKSNCHLIAISKYQKELISMMWQGKGIRKLIDKFNPVTAPEIHVIYNPVDDTLQIDETDVQANKLLFFSAPDRGIEQILTAFKQVKKYFPDYELHIAHPGYASLEPYKHLLQMPGINVLGSLAHQDIITHIRQAYCVFYPQTKKPECFGLVYAEANAVGTPVLAHDFGAAREILLQGKQRIDANNPQAIINTLKAWRTNGRPKVTLADCFRPQGVMSQWDTVLG